MPFLATFLVGLTGNNMMPAFLIAGGCVISLVAISGLLDEVT